MKIAISNIAWRLDEEEYVFELMKKLEINFLEISPKKIWDNPFNLNHDNLNKFTNNLKEYKIKPIAMQSLLYKKPELNIFADDNEETLKYLENMLVLGSKLKIKSLIFGAPKNKIRGKMPLRKALDKAINFFRILGNKSHNLNMFFCIEPTPKVYGADFICNIDEAVNLVKKVNSDSFGLNLDLGSMKINHELSCRIIKRAMPYTKHFHISEPYLETINLNEKFHKSIAHQLFINKYKECVSVEMLAKKKSNIQTIYKVLSMVKNIYEEN